MKQQILEEAVDDMLRVFKRIIELADDPNDTKIKIIKRWAQNTRYNILHRLNRSDEIT
jgi:hypothetical protein